MSNYQAGDQPEGSKLTEEERKMVNRLFSDPTYFPVEFRLWLKNYIENAGITITEGQIRGGGSSRTGMPPGLFIACGSVAAVPLDALQCDGAAYSRTTYSVLFAKIGTSWGPGDGSTTFNVPDVKDRALYGAGVAVSPGATDGQTAASRHGADHGHPGSPHNHPFGREVVSLQTGSTAFSILGGMGSHDVVTDMATDQAGPGAPYRQNGPNWAGAVYAITTGQAG